MAESTLSLSRAELIEELGDFLAYGRAPTGDDLTRVDSYIKAGYRQFLFPPPLRAGEASHRWSFLTPVETLALVDDDWDYDLPDDFGYLIGTFTYEPDVTLKDIVIVSEQMIRELRQKTSSDARPAYAAVRAKVSDATDGQRFEVVFYPTPSSADTLTYRYARLVDALTEAAPYPLGGMQHAETVLESCLAVAEERGDDTSGLHRQRFRELLLASVALDRQSAPDYLGYNADFSDGPPIARHNMTHWQYNSQPLND